MGDRLRDLAGSEVMTWDVDSLPVQVSEAMGPLRVALHGETVRLHPWHTHPVVRKGVLYILDIAAGGRVLREYEPGTWGEVSRALELAGMY